MLARRPLDTTCVQSPGTSARRLSSGAWFGLFLGLIVGLFTTGPEWLGLLLGGIIVVEVLFSYPGVGSLLDQAVQARDTTVVQAVALIVAAAYIAINIVADLAVVLLVPRLRTTVL